MYYVYILKDKKSEELYYGYTNNVERRLTEHNKQQQRWKLVYYEAYSSESDARKREVRLKQYGQSRSHLKNRIRESLNV